MGSRGKPLTGAQIAGVLIFSAACLMAGALQVDVGTMDVLVAALLATYVVGPLATLGHELGHALALTLLDRSSMVIVGRGPFLRIKADPAIVLFSPMPTRGVPFRGICRYNPAGLSWRAIGWVSLAGPLATAVELIALGLLGAILWPGSSQVVRTTLVFSASGLLTSLVKNLLPRGAAARPGIVSHDGDTARMAFARHRAGAPPPVAAASVPSRPAAARTGS
jgi:hypothetical protein